MASITTRIAKGSPLTWAEADANFTNLNTDKIETSVISTDGTMAANSDALLPSQKAVKTYVDARVPDSTTTSSGVAEGGLLAKLDSGGRLDRTLLAPDGYQRQKRIVLSDTGNVGDLGNFGGTALDSLLQIQGTSDLSTGLQTIKWGNDAKGIQDYMGKSRGASYGDIAAVALGDRIYTQNIQAAGSFGAFGHVGYQRWTIDGVPDSGSEMAGRWTLGTGTGNNISEDPAYYGLHVAIAANSRQQVYFPGPLTTSLPADGTYFGANVRIGIGGSAPGQGPVKFDLTGTALLATPEAGVLEADNTGVLYFTNAAGVRAALGSGGGSGTVTSVSVTTANGVSGSVATATTTPAITLTLGAITPSSVAASGTVTGSNLSGTNTGDQTSVTGNAGTATALQTSRNFSISGGGITAAAVGFTGAANVVLSASVDAGHVTLARMADVATASVFYRKTAGTGAPEVQTLATLKTDLGLTGTNSGDQTITLTGDISGTGTGSFATTLATVNANVGAFGSASLVPVITVNAKGLITAVSTAAIAGGGTVTSVSGAGTVSGLTLTGTVTNSGSITLGGTLSISGTDFGSQNQNRVLAAPNGSAGVPTFRKLVLADFPTIAAGTILGNNTGGVSQPLELTGAQVKTLLAVTSADISDFNSATRAQVEAELVAGANITITPSGSGATRQLTIAAAGGSGSPGGTSGDIQFNDGAGGFAGATNTEIDAASGTIKLVSTTDPAAPAGGLLLYSKSIAGRHMPKIIGPSGVDTVLQAGLSGNAVFMAAPASGTTAPTVIGGTLTTAATMSLQQTIASANPWQATARKRWASAATAGSVTGMRTAYVQWFRGNAAGFGGFFFRTQIGQNLNVNGAQVFHGLCASTGALATTAGAVAALLNMIGMGYDTTDSSAGNWQLYRNDGAGTATKVDLGANAARNTTHGYDLIIYCPPGAATDIFVRITNLHTNVVVLDTSYNTDLPAVNVGMAYKGEGNNGAVAAAMNLEVAKVYIESDY